MAKRYPYTTHTTPPLVLDVQPDDDEWVVTLAGDRIKEEGRAKTREAAIAIADPIRAHYEERKKTDPEKCDQCNEVMPREKLRAHKEGSHK